LKRFILAIELHLTMYGNAVLLEVEVFTAQQANL
jgi:hypothetical protein